ncbi:protein DpdJ [Telluria sp. Tellsp104]
MKKWNTDLAVIECVLNEIEKHEAKVLVWGLVDAALTADELRAVVGRALDSAEVAELMARQDCTLFDIDAVLDRLTSERLVFELPFELGYRSRMAESVRLFARLRQLFPKHKAGNDWTTAPTLVADYRFLWRHRKYPKRNISGPQALTEFNDAELSPEMMEVLAHRIDQEPGDWKLARFQVDATTRILCGMQEGRRQGTMVAAGTGSGKTLAFYLPGLSALAAEVRQSSAAGTRILAIYPRKELLKDQFAEVYEQARKFDSYLANHGGRKLTVGVLFGDTPQSLVAIPGKRSWRNRGDRWVCPYLRCPKCSGDLTISRVDIDNKTGRLVCDCGTTVESDEVRLTRDDLAADPPHVLFMTTEMLNQQMTNSELRHVFGIGPRALVPPRMVLLDEVHIYSGSYGAQVAYLLRRWSALTKYRASFVGLSATLSNGAAFFASLTGLDPSAVAEISPQPDDMKSEGAEYMMALRGDPVSRSALLSTSIQTLLLSSRILDPRPDVATRPFYGWRAFAFTDQMDSTNRLYLDLVDAEGMQINGRPSPRHRDGGLAHLREPRADRYRYLGGQDWRLARSLGHKLDTRHRVSRTTSYDQGVNGQAEVVIATAALEVGYDDPHVGVVLQHKAPRDMAQFLQRKGRAGRTRHMRPWTLMVLSDYGRDRLAYQAYEQYFDPELPARMLPLSNRYVLRMQAVYTLIDYLGREMQQVSPTGSVWRDLGGPLTLQADAKAFAACRHELINLIKSAPAATDRAQVEALIRNAQQIGRKMLGAGNWDAKNWATRRLRLVVLTRLLSDLLSDADKQAEFLAYLRGAMHLSASQAHTLLWDHPRPLLLGAVPTALRRVSGDWRAVDGTIDYHTGAPLPEFIPAALFSDLSLPEVKMSLPEGVFHTEERFLPVLQALGEMAPGKVSRRFDVALWLAPDDEVVLQLSEAGINEAAVDVDAWYDVERQPDILFERDGTVEHLAAFRPYQLKLRRTPEDVADTSNARLRWLSQLFTENQGARFTPPPAVGIAALFAHIDFQTHALQAPATVRRYVTASHAQMRIKRDGSNAECEALWYFEREGKPCGIGFELESDAVVFALRLPPSLSAVVDWSASATTHAVRQERYLWEARNGDELAAVVGNVFRRDWLAQIFIAAVALRAVRGGVPLATAIADLGSGGHDTADAFQEVMEASFQMPLPSEGESPDRLRRDLQEDLARPDVLQALAATAQLLVAPIDDNWDAWLEATMRQTMAAGLLEALQQFCPEVQSDHLMVDIDPGLRQDGQRPESAEIWISESNPGGNGLIEQFHTSFQEEPERFFRLLEAALGASEFEVIDAQLRALLSRIGGANQDDNLVNLVAAVRSAPDVAATDSAYLALRRALIERGMAVFHGFASALGTRVLRRDMPREFDLLLHEMLERWEQVEGELGVEIDARIICTLYSDDLRVDSALHGMGFQPPADGVKGWRFSLLYGLLWARGNQLRSATLQLPNRFTNGAPATERLLLSQWASAPDLPVDGVVADWRERATRGLEARGQVAVTVPVADQQRVREVIAWSISEPIQLEYLNLYPRLAGLRRHGHAYELQFELRESM